MPLLDDGAELVAGELHAVEVGEAVLALDILADEAELAEVELRLVEVAERHLEDTALQEVAGDL